MATLLNIPIGPVGFGLMGLTRPDHILPIEQSFDCMNAAWESGANYWNGGEFYGPPERNSLHLARDYFMNHPKRADEIVLCIKGNRTPGTLDFDGSEKGIRRSIDECVRVLGESKRLDIFECARVDPDTPIEETMRVLAQCVKEGKIRGIGLSEVKSDTIYRAAKIHKIAQVEVELSLWATAPLSNGIAKACAELKIPLMAYAPLSRGGLTAQLLQTSQALPEHLKVFPRFQGDALAANLRLTREVAKVASAKGCSLPQIALAWVRGQSERNGNPVIIPIPGAEKREWVIQNSNIEDVTLTEEEMQTLDGIVQEIPVKGERYSGPIAQLMDG